VDALRGELALAPAGTGARLGLVGAHRVRGTGRLPAGVLLARPLHERKLRAQYRSLLGRRPYDLRHAAMSLWLNSGVPATEVARRAGHGVAVLLKIYAHCIDGQANAANQRITDALGTKDAGQDPDEKGDGDSEPAA
jgi:integrase